MSPCRAISSMILGLAVLASGIPLTARPVPQTKAPRPDSDINAIGHRDVGKGVNLYSLDKEKQLGGLLAREVDRSSRLIDDPVLAAYLDRIAQNIAKNSDARFPITIRVIDSEEINGFTLPGGFQFINKGLFLQAEGEAELAGVLAHGIAHTAIRSSTTEATKGEFMQLATIPLILLGPGGWAGSGTYQGMDLSIPLTYLKNRRDAERSADYFALQYLYKTGYDPESFPRFLERVWPLAATGSKAIPKTLNPYPPLTERVAYMKKEIATILPPRDGAIVSSAEFDEMKARLLAWKSKQMTGPEGNQAKPMLRKPADHSTLDPITLMPDCE
jgi:beta-barrel assembly-enhancing protease